MNNRQLIEAALSEWPRTRLRPDTVAYHDQTTVVLISPDHHVYVTLANPTTPQAVAKAQTKMEREGYLIKIGTRHG